MARGRDFCPDTRDKVSEVLRERTPQDSLLQIGKLQPKAAGGKESRFHKGFQSFWELPFF